MGWNDAPTPSIDNDEPLDEEPDCTDQVLVFFFLFLPFKTLCWFICIKKHKNIPS
jgi:hypothetical protein